MNQPTTPNTVDDFLPLPVPIAPKGTWYSMSSPEDHYNADQMHAYVLADRAQRTPAAPVVATSDLYFRSRVADLLHLLPMNLEFDERDRAPAEKVLADVRTGLHMATVVEEGLALSALRKLCEQLEKEPRRMRHTPGTGQNHAYFDADEVTAHVEEARASLAAHPVAGSPAEPELVLALPDYEKRRIVIASDEMIGCERLVCVAIEDAEPMPASEAATQTLPQEHVMPPMRGTDSQLDAGDAALCANIKALLELDAAGVLVPHGIGGHARALLERASTRIAGSARQGGNTNDSNTHFAAPAAPTDAKPDARDWNVGNLLTMSDCDYPGMGSMFAQVWQGDDLIARVYGDTADEVRSRANRVAAQSVRDAAQPSIAAEDVRDAARLMFAMQDIDGFGVIKLDKYDYAIQCAEARGSDEPNADDELNGVRKLIDLAIAATQTAPQSKTEEA